MMFIITVQCKLAGFLAMEDSQTACAQNIAKTIQGTKVC